MFNSLFGNKKKTEETAKGKGLWVNLTTFDQLGEIAEKSFSVTQIIFKHSTTCGTSRMVLNMFENQMNDIRDKAEFYYLDLHRFRDLSDAVGKRFNVLHQSPQLLIIRNGVVVAHDSHAGIMDIALNKFL